MWFNNERSCPFLRLSEDQIVITPCRSYLCVRFQLTSSVILGPYEVTCIYWGAGWHSVRGYMSLNLSIRASNYHFTPRSILSLLKVYNGCYNNLYFNVCIILFCNDFHYLAHLFQNFEIMEFFFFFIQIMCSFSCTCLLFHYVT